MKFFCKATALSFLAAAALALVACGGDSGASSPDNGGETGVTSVTLSAANNVTVGETITLTATPNATPTSNQYRWTVSNATVAQLNNSSDTTITTSSNTVTLKGAKAGTVSVTVTVDGVKSNTLSVTVNAASASEPTLQSVTISGGGEIEATGTATLTASPTFTATASGTPTYTWTITHVNGTAATSTSYAELTPSGNTATLKGKNTTASEVTVTVKVTATYNGNPRSNTATVTIAAQGETVQNKLTGLTLVPEATSLNPKADTVLTAAATYSGTVLLSYEWKIIKVDGKDVTDDTSAYATLSSETGRDSRAATTVRKYNTLTNTNTTAADHVITVQLTATNTADSTNYITKTADITVKGAKITGIAIEADSETISSDGKATLTADVATTDDSVKYEVTWAITAVNGIAGATTEYAMLTKNADGTATLTGKNTSGAKLTVAITATATNKNDATNTEDTTKTITIAREGVSAAYYPLSDEEAAYADTYLEITFEDTPVINRASSGSVRIYKKGGTLVDTIKPAAEKLYGYGVGGNASYGEINAQYQLIQVIDEKTVRIIPHHGATAQKATLLENGTEYYVLIDNGLITGTVDGKAFAGITDTNAWTFKTGTAPNVSGNTLTVGKDKQFVTVQGALSYLMANNKSGNWQINIDKGTYYERIFYSGKANITMSGQGSATYGTDVEIQWCNQDGGESTTLWNTGSRGRNVFYYAGGNLVLENLSIINTATRKSNEYGEHDNSATSDNANGNNQAEALLFDSTGTCAAYNCNFTSKQDTVYLSPSGGKAWFYGCKISGDVDFIWGLSDVALFEKCNIISAYDADKSSNHTTYVVASHLHNTSAPYGKGFVVYNSTITTESGQTTYLARSPWGKKDDDKQIAQVAIIDTAVTGGLASSPWYENHVGGTDETVLGWKWYGVTFDGSAIVDTYKITQAQYEAEFAGRRNILNRVYNGSAFEKDSTSYWDISSLLARWGIAECGSKETLTGETEVTSVVWNTSTAALSQTRNETFYMYTDLTTTETVPTGNALYNYLYCDGSANDYIQASLELYGTAAIYVPVKTTSTATIAFIKGAGTLKIAGDEYTASGTATVDCSTATLVTKNGIKYVEIRVAGTAGGASEKYYINNIVVTTEGTAGDTTDDDEVTEDSWTLTGRTDTLFSTTITATAASISSDATVKGEKSVLSLTLSSTGTDVGTSQSTPNYKYNSSSGLCIKYDALKIEGITGDVALTITGKNGGSTERNLEVTIGASGSVNTKAISSNTSFTYTQSFTGNNTTVYIGASNELYIGTITIASASGNSEEPSVSDYIISDGGTITDSDNSSRSGTLTITKGETPTGYAGLGYTSSYSASSYTNGTVTVTTRADLVAKANAGGYFIIVDGMIDMTDGMLPSVGGGTTTKLDEFVNSTSSGKYADYSTWVASYAAACSTTSDDEKSDSEKNTALFSDLWTLSNAYKKQIQLVVNSNTAIVGKDASSGIKGANISLSDAKNVVLRNLIIQDAYDPFPHHEVKDDGVSSDGYNAQWDCITIQDNKSSAGYIWIDHCTIQDTMTLSHVKTGGKTEEKWQTYDGLLDIKGLGANITVSYCKFKNHDKTSLIGSGDSEGNATTRLITYHHNYFYNCGQRLPMIRNTTMHLYNNYYAYSSGAYSQQYAVGVRKGSIVYAENNYFDSGIRYAFSDSGSSSSSGTLHSSGNVNNASSGQSLTNTVQTDSFTVPNGYPSYTLESAETVKTNLPTQAGTGAVTIGD